MPQEPSSPAHEMLHESRMRTPLNRELQRGDAHMMIMATGWVCFLLALVLPISVELAIDHSLAQLAAAGSAGVGFLPMSVGGWLGGRLAYEFGIGVRDRVTS
jgi:uncharacterized membrane protein